MSAEALERLTGELAAAFPDAETATAFGEATLTTTPAAIPDVLKTLRDDARFAFTTLIDLTAVDYPERAERFDVVYHFLSMTKNIRLRVKIRLADGAAAPSCVEIFPAANWFEREAFDMYGVLFANHPDLRRILTDYGFSGHPLRKDFPLTGYVEVRYDDDQKRVVYDAVKLQQEFRSFDYLSPWEGQRRLPGDEKATTP